MPSKAMMTAALVTIVGKIIAIFLASMIKKQFPESGIVVPGQ